MGEIRSPYFSIDQRYLEDDAEIRSPYFSSGGDYLGNNAEIYSPFSFGTRDYHRDDAQIHSPYFSIGGYHGEAEIPHETFFEQNIVEYPYNADKFVEQDTVLNIYSAEKLIRQRKIPALPQEVEDAASDSRKTSPNDEICIYRVPDALRKSNEAIYTPQEISIGPIHYLDNEKLQPMETQKKSYMNAFCNRMAEKTKEQKIEFLFELWKIIKEHRDKILQCYENYENFNDQLIKKEGEFEKMVLFDAGFIFEYFLRSKDRTEYVDDGLMWGNKSRDQIRWDLMLLENQLPFFILEKLYEHFVQEAGEDIYTSFRDLAHEYFDEDIKSNYKPSDTKQILHFTDLIRNLLSFNKPDWSTREPIKNIYSATKLHKAGIKFKESGNECLLDINFIATKGELHIPRLQIDSNTEKLFGNLMALELRCYKGKEYVCHYVKLFEILVATPKDANLLIKNNIVETNGDGATVKDLIDMLSARTFENYSCYQTLYKQLDQYYESSWLKNTAYFREVYFGNVWKGTATVSATLLLLFSFTQIIFSIVSLR